MKVGYDLVPIALDRAGARRYAASLLRALHRNGEITVEPLALTRRRPAILAQRITYQAAAEAFYYPLLVPKRARRAGLDLVHYPRHTVAPALRLDVPYVMTVHDVLPLRQPQHFTRLIAERYRLLVPRVVARAACVLTGSAYSKSEIVEMLGVPPERVVTTPYGVEERFGPIEPDRDWLRARFGIQGRFVLCVGTLEPRKNLPRLVRAFESIQHEFPSHALVVAGSPGWKTDEFERLLKGTSARLIRTGYVTDDELIRLYSAADCFAFPSFSEGFGFPVLEAMACGAPVVASDRGSLAEVVGDAGVLVDPDSTEALASAIAGVLGSNERQAELARRGLARSRSFSWTACARATVHAYRTVVTERP